MAKKIDKKKEAARRMREQRAREERRKKILIGGGASLLALLVVGLIGLGLWLNNKSYEYVEPAEVEHSENAVTIGDGPVELDLYEDFMCPACGSFEQANGQAIKQAVDDGMITLNYHPVRFLNPQSQGTDYSSRAASAAICAADENLLLEFNAAMYAQGNQPQEGSKGLTNEEIANIGTTQVGLSEDFASCVEDQTYRGWVEEAADQNEGEDFFSGTPTVLINGEKIEQPSNNFATAFQAALAAAAEEGGEDGDPSAEPSAEASSEEESEEN